MKSKSILIIDDELDICMLLKNYFKNKNNNVFFAVTLDEGIKKFNQYKPDLLIIDHNLPDGNGIDNIHSFKDSNLSLYVIVISAMSNLKSLALENGADYFMEKPISFSKLNALLTQNTPH